MNGLRRTASFWREHDPAARQAQTIQFLKNASMLGGLVLELTTTQHGQISDVAPLLANRGASPLSRAPGSA